MAIFKYKKKKYVNGIDYDKNINYTEEMEKAKASGDTARLAILEDERNKKIDGENLSERKTYNYIDVGTKIENGIRDGESPYVIKEYVDARRDKAMQNKEYDSYKNDEIQKKGLQYYHDEVHGAGYEDQRRPEKKNRYEDEIRTLLNRINSTDEFEYNPDEDEVYKRLKSQMQNESRRAATDVLADVQSQGGGKSSYAVSAAMQAANTYNAKLAEELPKLYEIAYKRYNDQKESDRKALESTLDAAEHEQNAYMDEYDQYNKDRDFARKAYESDINYMAKEDETARKAVEAARDLVTHYEEAGIAAPDVLLAIADMEDLAEINMQNAENQKYLQNLEIALKNRQIDNYIARTNKTYSDISNNAEKLKLQKEKQDDSKNKKSGNAINLDDYDLTNKKETTGYYVGGIFYNFDKLQTALEKGLVIIRENPDGTASLEKNKNYK